MRIPQKYLFSGKAMAGLIVPMVVELSLKLVVGMVDSVMVSTAGEAAVSGVSLIDTVMQLIIYIFAAMASGGAVVAGQYLGRGDRSLAKKAADELMWLNTLLAGVVTVAVLAASQWIVGSLFGDIADAVAVSAGDYLFYTAFSIPAIAVFEAGAAVFRTMNDSKTTMKISLLMNVINCVGNTLLIYGCAMGVKGAAISTLAARWAAAVIITILLLNQKRELCLKRTLYHRFHLQLTKQILRVGVPGGVENGVFQIGKIILVGLAATFGTSAITANAITQTLASIEVIPGSAVQLAAVTLIARCVGAGDYEQAKFYNRKLLKITYISHSVLGAAMYFGLPLILSVYSLTPETGALIGAMFLWHTIGAVTVWPLAFDLPAALRAAGVVKYPMVLSIVSMWVFRFGGAYLLSKSLGIGAVGIWIAMAVLDWGFRAVGYVFRWRSGKWKTKGIIE